MPDDESKESFQRCLKANKETDRLLHEYLEKVCEKLSSDDMSFTAKWIRIMADDES